VHPNQRRITWWGKGVAPEPQSSVSAPAIISCQIRRKSSQRKGKSAHTHSSRRGGEKRLFGNAAHTIRFVRESWLTAERGLDLHFQSCSSPAHTRHRIRELCVCAHSENQNNLFWKLSKNSVHTPTKNCAYFHRSVCNVVPREKPKKTKTQRDFVHIILASLCVHTIF
jgi:hypothetical protein